MGVSGQCHAPATFYLWYPLDRRLGRPEPVWTQRLEEKSFASVWYKEKCASHTQNMQITFDGGEKFHRK
jgi:hypothetical protein